ncbi:MAG: cell wall-binding repeat-containing protein [Clostridia bacterium]|nr:cell wall-binding repeat-containing protein [Clostridia bacterium]
MNRNIGRAAAVLLALILLMMAAVPAAYADDPGEIQNPSISEAGILTWDAYPGAVNYRVGISWFYKTTTETTYDLQAYIDEVVSYDQIPPKGSVYVTVRAYDASENMIAEWEVSYSYESSAEVTPKGTLQNVKIDENGILSWDEWPGADQYWVGIDGGYRTSPDASPTTYDVNAYLDEFEAFGELEKPGTHKITINVNSSEGYLLAEWKGYVTVTKNGEDTEFKLEDCEIKNAAISADGILSWDAVPCAAEYMIDVDGWQEKTTEVTFDLQAFIDELVAREAEPASGTVHVVLTALDSYGDTIAEWSKDYEYESSAVPLTGIVENIQISDAGIMTWDAYTGTAVYGICVNAKKKTTSETAFDLKAFIEELVKDGEIPPGGSVYAEVTAYDSDDNSIASGGISYDYETSFEPGTIENVKVSADGTLTWDAYPGALSYNVFINSGYKKEVTGTSFDLKAFIDEMVSHEVIPQKGGVSVTVRAYRSGDYPVAEETISYEYDSTAEVTPKGEIQNVKIDENGILSWDEWPGTDTYWVGVEGGWRTSSDETPAKYDVGAYLDEFEGYGYLVKEGTHSLCINAENADGYLLADWSGFVTVTKDGEGWKYELTDGKEMIRLAGANRYATAIEAAEHLKKKRGLSKFDNIIIASGAGFPDALSASYLAVWKNAPILLVNDGTLAQITDYACENLAAGGTVYIIGGTGAVPGTVDEALAGKIGAESITRFAGKNRYETNLLVLEECAKTGGLDGKELMVASGKGFADALSASAARRPIMLVGDVLLEDQIKFIKEKKASLKEDGRTYIVGGTGAVSEKVEETLKAAEGLALKVKRYAGSDRYETSRLIAGDLFSYSLDTVVIANARNFPDGLSGGPVASYYYAPLILVTDSVYDHAVDYYKYVGARRLVIMGGTGVISDETADLIAGTE